MSQGGFDIMQFMPIILIFVIFYFLMIRPQQKKAKEHQAMLLAIRRGDRIVTNGGLIGQVSKVVSDAELLIEIADNVKVRVSRAMIADVLTKTEAVNSDEKVVAETKTVEKKAATKKAPKAKSPTKKD